MLGFGPDSGPFLYSRSRPAGPSTAGPQPSGSLDHEHDGLLRGSSDAIRNVSALGAGRALQPPPGVLAGHCCESRRVPPGASAASPGVRSRCRHRPPPDEVVVGARPPFVFADAADRQEEQRGCAPPACLAAAHTGRSIPVSGCRHRCRDRGGRHDRRSSTGASSRRIHAQGCGSGGCTSPATRCRCAGSMRSCPGRRIGG